MPVLRHVIGIDPSRRSGTGLVHLDMTDQQRPKILAATCIKLSAKELREMSHTEQEGFIVKAAEGWTWDRHCEIGIGTGIDLVSIEWPGDRERAIEYTRKDKSKGSRSLTSNSQWRLIGRLQHLCEAMYPVQLVTVQQCRAAVGIPSSARRKPVAEVAKLTGYPMHQEAKYVAEAVADAAAAGLAGYAAEQAEILKRKAGG